MAENEGRKSRMQSLLSSSAGLIAAIVILVVFILAATFFKPVVFGLLLAYLFLPLEGFYRNYLLKNKLFNFISMLLSSIFFPIIKPAKALKNKVFKYVKIKTQQNSEPDEKQRAQKYIKRSCALTIITVFIIMIFLLSGIAWLSTTYINNASTSISAWAKKTASAYEKKPDLTEQQKLEQVQGKDEDSNPVKEFFEAVHYKIEALKPKLQQFRIFVLIKEYLGANLSSPDSMREIIKNVIDRSGGVFSYTAGILGTLIFVFLKIIFTFFFFAFFLKKLVNFNCNKEHKVSTGTYLTDAIMESRWFPHTKEVTRENAAKILDNILFRLKIWVRGYFMIILIEGTFYATVFTLIGVPFGLILGIIAGFTILLPYIGPIGSAILTVAVCLASGNTSMVQILLVVIAYIFMTGFLDQLFIYPAVVGASLGLNELETIVVVILGGMFFGITGMIFAVPTTSVLKYLIPEIYNLIEQNRNINDN